MPIFLFANHVFCSSKSTHLIHDILLSSSFRSTFGYVINALAARPTYFMNIVGQQFGENLPYATNGRPVCEKAWSHGACFHMPPTDLECPGGNPYNEKDSKDWLPYIRACQDVGDGIAVLPLVWFIFWFIHLLWSRYYGFAQWLWRMSFHLWSRF